MLSSFGPDLELANELLQAGERASVLAYLEACSRFWKSGQGQVTTWIAAIREGETPQLDRTAR